MACRIGAAPLTRRYMDGGAEPLTEQRARTRLGGGKIVLTNGVRLPAASSKRVDHCPQGRTSGAASFGNSDENGVKGSSASPTHLPLGSAPRLRVAPLVRFRLPIWRDKLLADPGRPRPGLPDIRIRVFEISNKTREISGQP